MPDVSELKRTILEQHILTRPISESAGGLETDHVLVDGTKYGVGQPFNPSAFWCGRYHRLIDAGYVTTVDAKLNRDLVEAYRSGEAGEVAKALDALGVGGDWDSPRDALAAAKATLKLKGLEVPAVEASKPPADLSELQEALDAENYNDVGKALKALGLDVPSTKAERFEAALEALTKGEA